MNLKELRSQLEATDKEIDEIIEQTGEKQKEGEERKPIGELEKRANELLEKRENLVKKIDLMERAEKRSRVATGTGAIVGKYEERGTLSDVEVRAEKFVNTNRLETRALLGSGKIAAPTKADGVNGLGEVSTSLVDDVNAIALTGNGSWKVAFKTKDAIAADVTDGSKIGGTGSTYDYVEITPSEWGVIDEVSNQVRKLTSVNYLNAIEGSALIALRAKACEKIIAALNKSALIEKKVSVALDQDYLRSLVLGFDSIEGKGEVKLYIGQEDLAELGKVRGQQEKKALYEIIFDAGTTKAGVIKEGGTAVKFRVVEQLTTGIQYFGQPLTIDMPMWDNYQIETDTSGEYFARNMMAIRGLQTAGVDLVAQHGMQQIKQAGE